MDDERKSVSDRNQNHRRKRSDTLTEEELNEIVRPTHRRARSDASTEEELNEILEPRHRRERSDASEDFSEIVGDADDRSREDYRGRSDAMDQEALGDELNELDEFHRLASIKTDDRDGKRSRRNAFVGGKKFDDVELGFESDVESEDRLSPRDLERLSKGVFGSRHHDHESRSTPTLSADDVKRLEETPFGSRRHIKEPLNKELSDKEVKELRDAYRKHQSKFEKSKTTTLSDEDLGKLREAYRSHQANFQKRPEEALSEEDISRIKGAHLGSRHQYKEPSSISADDTARLESAVFGSRHRGHGAGKDVVEDRLKPRAFYKPNLLDSGIESDLSTGDDSKGGKKYAAHIKASSPAGIEMADLSSEKHPDSEETRITGINQKVHRELPRAFRPRAFGLSSGKLNVSQPSVFMMDEDLSSSLSDSSKRDAIESREGVESDHSHPTFISETEVRSPLSEGSYKSEDAYMETVKSVGKSGLSGVKPVEDAKSRTVSPPIDIPKRPDHHHKDSSRGV